MHAQGGEVKVAPHNLVSSAPRTSAAVAQKNVGQDETQMVTCTDMVTYAERNSSATVVGGILGGASGLSGIYQVFPDFTGNVTEVYVTAKKKGTGNATIHITVHPLNGSDPDYYNIGAAYVGSVTSSTYTQYGGVLSTPVPVSGGFALCVWNDTPTDSCTISLRQDPNSRELSYMDLGSAGTVQSMFSAFGAHYDAFLRPKISYTGPTVTSSANPNSACVGSPVNFTSSASGVPAHYNNSYNIYNTTPTYNWTFGDAGTATTQNPQHTYLSSGTYTATATYSYSCWTTGCSASGSTSPITVSGATASVSIQASATTVCSGDNINFQATPTGGGTGPTYVWKKNGFQVGTGVAYSATGWSYGDVMTCEMTSNAACAPTSPVVSNSIVIFLYPGATSAFSYVASGLIYTFTSAATNATSYLWDFGDSQTSVAPNPSHTYATPGLKTVILTVTNQCGGTNISTLNVNVANSGNSNGSNVSVVENDQAIQASAYPNPAGDMLSLSYSLQSNADLTVELVNNLGQVVYTQKVENTQTGVANISMVNLPEGMYFVRMNDGQSQTVIPVAH